MTKALTKDKDERYQTVKDMAIDLRRLSGGWKSRRRSNARQRRTEQ